jgi:hypothetical protein
LPRLEERIANTAAGAITSIQAVYVPADDLTDPSAVHTFSHLSASIVLSRKRASEGLYPAIDLLQSSSKMATPGIVGERHYRLAQEIRQTLAQYEDLKDVIAMLGLEQLSPMIVRWSPVPDDWSDSSPSHFLPPSNLAVLRENLSASKTRLMAVNESCTMNSKTTQKVHST